MWKFLPWKFLVKRAARHYGVLDPAMLMARIRRFSQPSEVAEPLELLRAGIVFHARGLVNTKAIQHNLDWVWPYWVAQQFDPESPSFVPRAFSFSHINLTHRNWTAVGRPDAACYPVVDPRGLFTPLADGWSLDFWVVSGEEVLLPSKLGDGAVSQRLHTDPNLCVRTRCAQEGMRVETAHRLEGDGELRTVTEVSAHAERDGWLVVAVRPYNPEGIQFIHRIDALSSGRGFQVNGKTEIGFSEAADGLRMAHYAEGDIYLDLHGDREQNRMRCDVGMATGAALFRLTAGEERNVEVSVKLPPPKHAPAVTGTAAEAWSRKLADTAELRIADERMQFLYDAAVRTLLLLSADEIVPGPYTYNRFWFRDACLMLHPLMLIGHTARAAEILESFPARQQRSGYFLSQEGEWDSNGQVLWIAARHAQLTGKPPTPALSAALRKGVDWLARKRLSGKPPSGAEGLLPAGFSAEHLGPNDYYYWDDFWAWGGLREMAAVWAAAGETEAAAAAEKTASDFEESIQASLAAIPESRSKGAVPAAPGRRLDAGAIGSMVADYPLRLYPPGAAPMMRTADFLLRTCSHCGGFFQEMIHSVINAYLTLDLAQTCLRAGDERFMDLMRNVAALATPAGQWPEAIHPRTLGGCMGDGQHGWAAAEWIMMVRNCFVREEEDRLVIGSGILPEWLADGEAAFGPAVTSRGTVRIRIADGVLTVEGDWRGEPPPLEVSVPGYRAAATAPGVYELRAAAT